MEQEVKSEIYDWLLQNGFNKNCKKGSYANGNGNLDYDCIKRVHVLHMILWHDNLKHFSIAVHNESGKSKAGGGKDDFTSILLPKPIYKISEAKQLIESISV